MTWKEFKNACQSLGLKDNDEINYIDIICNDIESIEIKEDTNILSTNLVITNRF